MRSLAPHSNTKIWYLCIFGIFLNLKVPHRALWLHTPLLPQLHHPSVELVGDVHGGLLVVHVDHVDVVDVPVAVGERWGRSSEAVTLRSQWVIKGYRGTIFPMLLFKVKGLNLYSEPI